ncbi:thioredoxin family protein [Streptomyces sp. NPDC005811]|uniref:thioredoxin family protein n=1 Tax=Streptomyces sp. NPDC005811 TaxID=3154565 RepID=UPI0033D234CC
MPSAPYDVDGTGIRPGPTKGAPHIGAASELTLPRLLAEHEWVIVWFTTEWCGPCASLAPLLDEFAVAHQDRFAVFAVDGDTEPELLRRYQVSGFPTLALFHRGIRVWQEPGFYMGRDLAEFFHATADAVAEIVRGRDVAEWDCEPKPPSPQGERVIVVPDAPEGLLRCAVVIGSEETETGEGTHHLPAGAELAVTLYADHRREQQVDSSLLAGFAPDSIDQLAVDGASAFPQDLGRYPAVHRVYSLRIQESDAEVLAPELAGMPHLCMVGLESPRSALSASVVVNGLWALPGLDEALPPLLGVHSEGSESSTEELAEGGTLVVTDEDWDRYAGSGLALVEFTLAGASRCEAVRPLLGHLADERPDLAVLAVDHFATEENGPLDARFENLRTDPDRLPLLVLLRDGRQIWRSMDVGDARSFDEVLRPALRSADQRPGRALSPMPARPARTLRLPDGALSTELFLMPPESATQRATRIRRGGIVEVPAGWSVQVRFRQREGAALVDRSTLESFGPGELDIVICGGPALAPSSVAELAAALDGRSDLRELFVSAENVSQWLPPLLPALSTLTGLRSLELSSPDGYSGDEFDAGVGKDIAVLRRALPDTIVNGCWSGLEA